MPTVITLSPAQPDIILYQLVAIITGFRVQIMMHTCHQKGAKDELHYKRRPLLHILLKKTMVTETMKYK